MHRRYVIDFGDMEESEAWHWKNLMTIVETKVKPFRDSLTTQSSVDRLKKHWWQFYHLAKESRLRAAKLPRIMVCSQTSKYLAIAFSPSTWVFDQKTVVFSIDNWSGFSVLQSSSHENWSTFLGSTMKDDPVYTPSKCFETFPFPKNFETNKTLEDIGQIYYTFRAELMIKNNEGLTKTYNRFHHRDHDGTGISSRSPADVIADIEKLRSLHAAMDRAVLDAYGWNDIHPTCEFILDYEDDDDDSDTGRKRKKPWRYKWPEEIHDEVLARLLALNAERAEEERLAGVAGMGEKKAGKVRKVKKVKDEGGVADAEAQDLFGG